MKRYSRSYVIRRLISSERGGEVAVFTCDGCGDHQEFPLVRFQTGTQNPDGTIRRAVRGGWDVGRTSAVCPTCLAGRRAAAAGEKPGPKCRPENEGAGNGLDLGPDGALTPYTAQPAETENAVRMSGHSAVHDGLATVGGAGADFGRVSADPKDLAGPDDEKADLRGLEAAAAVGSNSDRDEDGMPVTEGEASEPQSTEWLLHVFLTELYETNPSWNDKTLGDAAHISPRSIMRYRENLAKPSAPRLHRLHEAIGVPLEELCAPESLTEKARAMSSDDPQTIRGMVRRAENIRRLMMNARMTETMLADAAKREMARDPRHPTGRQWPRFRGGTLRAILAAHDVDAVQVARVARALKVPVEELDRVVEPQPGERGHHQPKGDMTHPVKAEQQAEMVLPLVAGGVPEDRVVAAVEPASPPPPPLPSQLSPEGIVVTAPLGDNMARYRYSLGEAGQTGRLRLEAEMSVDPATVQEILDLLADRGARVRLMPPA